ncbi:MAG TPA: MATE family efflux transporter [Labilithrix sp.]|nr:MATE family efflux transporter [Labilithrix sp.]
MNASEGLAARRERRRKREVAHEQTRVIALEGRPEATNVPCETKKRVTPTRDLIELAWPIAAAMLGETALGLVDTKLVGGLGPGALGGVGIATTFMFLGYSVVFGIMRGVKVRTAHAIGEGRPLDGFVYARSGMILGFALGIVIMLACRDVSGVLRALGTDPAIVPYASDFLAAVTLGAPQTCALAALIQHRQAIGDSRTPMVVGIAGNTFNAVFAWSLIYGHLGLPAMGVRGGGWATATTETLELAALAVMLLRSEKRARAAESSPSPVMPLRQATRHVAELGVPTGLQFGVETLAFAAFTAVLGGIGGAQIAAHQIALNVIRVSFLPGVAIAEAASVMVGRALGKRSLEEADAAAKAAVRVAIAFMAACGVVFAVTGGVIAEFFSKDAEVVAVARRLLLMAAAFQVLDAVNIVYRGSLRGAKDVRVAAAIGIGTMWLFIPTAAWFLGRNAGLGALGGWIGFLCETTVGGTLVWLRLTKGSWRKNYAPRESD